MRLKALYKKNKQNKNKINTHRDGLKSKVIVIPVIAAGNIENIMNDISIYAVYSIQHRHT